MHRLSVGFGRPQHGWLPVSVCWADSTLQFAASDVPVDPLSLLIEALSRVLDFGEGEVWWHLEPASYFFLFNRAGDLYSLRILLNERGDNRAQAHEVLSASGSVAKLVLRFWHALRRLQADAYGPPDWPEFSPGALDALIRKLDQVGTR